MFNILYLLFYCHNIRYTPCLKEYAMVFYFHDDIGNSGPIFKIIHFTATFRNVLRKKLELKLSHPINLLPHYLSKHTWSTIHFIFILVTIIMLHIRWHLFH